MEETFDFKIIENIIHEINYKKGTIIDILQSVQEQYNYLPKEIFSYLAKKLCISEAEIYSVATFYKSFSLEPKGKYVIKVCDGTACHVKKSVSILNRIHRELGLSKSKATTDDLIFTVETVSCLGACGLAPVVMINDKIYPHMTADKASELLKRLK